MKFKFMKPDGSVEEINVSYFIGEQFEEEADSLNDMLKKEKQPISYEAVKKIYQECKEHAESELRYARRITEDAPVSSTADAYRNMILHELQGDEDFAAISRLMNRLDQKPATIQKSKEKMLSIVFDTGESFDLTEQFISSIFENPFRKPWSKRINLEYFNHLFNNKSTIRNDSIIITVSKIQEIIQEIETESDIHNLNYLLYHLPTQKNLLIREQENQRKLNKQKRLEKMTNQFILLNNLDHLKDKIKLSDSHDIMHTTLFYFTDVPFESIETIADSLRKQGLEGTAEKSPFSSIINDYIKIKLTLSQLERWLKTKLETTKPLMSEEKPEKDKEKPSIDDEIFDFQTSRLPKVFLDFLYSKKPDMNRPKDEENKPPTAIKIEEAKKMEEKMLAIQTRLHSMHVIGDSNNSLVSIVTPAVPDDDEAELRYEMLHPSPTPR